MLNQFRVCQDEADAGGASVEPDGRPGDGQAAPDPGVLPTRELRLATPRHERTARRLTILGGLLVAAIFGAAGLLIAGQHGAALAESQRVNDNLAQVLAEQTARTIQPVDLTLRDVLARLTAAASDSGDETAWGSRAIFDLLVERLKGLPQVEALMVIGADGHVVNYSRHFPPAVLDVSARDHFQYLRQHDDHALFVSVPLPSFSTGNWTVFLGRRVNDARGDFAGVVLASVTLSYLGDFYRAVAPEGSAVTLIRRDGLILVRHPASDERTGVRLPEQLPWYRVVAEGGGSYFSPGLGGDIPHLVSVHPLREFPLVVDVSITQTAAMAAWRWQACWMIFGAIFASACVIFLLRLFGLQYNRLARQNEELETRRVQFDTVLGNMSQGLTFIGADQKLMICNRRYTELYRLAADQTRPGMALSDLLRLTEVAGSFPNMTIDEFLARRRVLAGAGEAYDVTDELRDGRTVSLHCRPLPDGGWVVTHEDITERRSAQAALLFMARHDPLTRLPNRTLFQERLAQAIATVGRGTHCALLCLDVDRFKVINDTLGHPVGDELLRAVASRLTAAARNVDTVARLGGDEFAVILVGLRAPGHAAGLARRIVGTLCEPYEIDGHRIIAGVSVGVSIAPKDGVLPDTLLKNADVALYLAKTQGRGTYRFFEPEIDAHVQRQRAVELDLRNAVPAEDFELHYQPILDLQSGRVTSFEALIRWHHPVKGMVSPADFIPIAEETGLIIPIGEWAIRKACQEAARWPDGIEVAVNLSPVQFRSDRILEVTRDALASSGLNANRLELEITESVLLENSSGRLRLLHQLRELGVRIALDDFGTGYSSLSYLRSFPFDKIKIDRAFIREVDTNKESTAIVNAIVGLGRSLGMTIVAEGVETREQLAMVRTQGCTKVQGYLFSRPRPAGEVAGLIRTLFVPEHADVGCEAGAALVP